MNPSPRPGVQPPESAYGGPYGCPEPTPPPPRRRSRRPGRFRRFVRGYLMLVGALTTLYVLVQLLVRLFIEIGKWMPPARERWNP